jgi:hypothetical protein
MENIARAQRPRHVSVVLSVEEVRQSLALVDGRSLPLASFLYGGGMRSMDALRLRIKEHWQTSSFRSAIARSTRARFWIGGTDVSQRCDDPPSLAVDRSRRFRSADTAPRAFEECGRARGRQRCATSQLSRHQNPTVIRDERHGEAEHVTEDHRPDFAIPHMHADEHETFDRQNLTGRTGVIARPLAAVEASAHRGRCQ